MLMLSFDDTIIAIASPSGRAARGIVRLSGPQAVALAESTFDPASGSQALGFRRVRGAWRLPPAGRCPEANVPAEIWMFRAPHSFTGQDCVEIHT
ncbi:MAG TPA: tRNA uridine-5-carboxymethylaminomethyl(34) synthesis GTPase MnmE, partial [Phycisphaerae bacterium]